MTKLDESKRASVRPSDLLAAAAAIAAGTQAYGEVIIFINPDEDRMVPMLRDVVIPIP
jgi:hypothetical protein